MDAESIPNGNGAKTAAKVLRDEGAIEILAKEVGLPPRQVIARCARIVWEAANAGNLEAAKDILNYAAAAWMGRGGASSDSMFRHIRRGMRVGALNLDHAVQGSKLARMKRDLEVSNIDRRLRVVEAHGAAGSVLRQHEDE